MASPGSQTAWDLSVDLWKGRRVFRYERGLGGVPSPRGATADS